MSPGGPSVCIQLFNASLKRVASWSFLAGWRAAIDQASLLSSSPLAQDLVVLRVVGFSVPHIVNEYFAISDKRLRLVRMENEKGELVAKDYWSNPEIAVMPEAKTASDWLRLLASKDPADVLSALVFLSGVHSRPGTGAQRLLANPRIRQSILHLTKSRNEWVRQASIFAASDPQ